MDGLLAELAVSARTIRRDVIAMALERVGPEISDVPILLLDETGERAGEHKGGVALHLTIGLVARRRGRPTGLGRSPPAGRHPRGGLGGDGRPAHRGPPGLDTNVLSELRKVRSGKANPALADWATGVPSGQMFLSAITILRKTR